MLVLYSNHCPKCNMIESILKNNNVDFVLEEREEVYLPKAKEHNIMSMPFMGVDDTVFLAGNNLQQYVRDLMEGE